MPPKKPPSTQRVAYREEDKDLSFLRECPSLRRAAVLLLLLYVIGMPCPAAFFYASFVEHRPWIRWFHSTGVFTSAVFTCEQAVGPHYRHDYDYYKRIQDNFNLTNEEMFDYMQQWLCVMPPDNYDDFISETLSRYADLLQDGDLLDDVALGGGLDNIDLEAVFQQEGANDQDIIKAKILNSMYQEVESEPLNL